MLQSVRYYENAMEYFLKEAFDNIKSTPTRMMALCVFACIISASGSHSDRFTSEKNIKMNAQEFGLTDCSELILFGSKMSEIYALSYFVCRIVQRKLSSL